MNILYTFPEPLPLPKARGIQTAWMVHALCQAGARVSLAHCPSPEGHPLTPLGRDLPANLRLLPLSRHWPFPLQRWHSVGRFVAQLLKHLDRERPDLVFVRHLKLAQRLLQARPDLPLVYEAHEVFAATAPESKRAALAAQEAAVLAGAAGVVFISGAVEAALQAAYPDARPRARTVLHSGVDLPPPGPEKDWAQCARHIVYAGSFYGWKGVDDLVAAAARLPGYRLTLLGGEAGEIERLKPRIDPCGAEVLLLPRLVPERVMAHLQEACIAVLPNRAEGVSQFTSPLKLFEYMGAGCALVTADLPSIREVLAPDQAAWFTPGDPESLAAALAGLAADPNAARRQGENLRQLAAHYTWDARARGLLDFMEQIRGGR